MSWIHTHQIDPLSNKIFKSNFILKSIFKINILPRSSVELASIYSSCFYLCFSLFLLLLTFSLYFSLFFSRIFRQILTHICLITWICDWVSRILLQIFQKICFYTSNNFLVVKLSKSPIRILYWVFIISFFFSISKIPFLLKLGFRKWVFP